MSKHQTLVRAEQTMDHFLADLKTIVNIDSGTFTKAGIDRIAEYLERRFHDCGFTTEIDYQQEYGNNLIATHAGNNPHGPYILIVGHMDTVFPAGDAECRPFTLSERNGMRIAMGPGILDMKSGLLIGMYGLHLLIAANQANYQRVVFICNSDEEIGSSCSMPLIQQLAQQADAVIVLEPGRIINTIVSSRRGISNYTIEVHGVSSHAGVEPQNGRNAILELAHKVVALQAINGTIAGTTLNVGTIRGGKRTNIVPDYACCQIDVRVSSPAGAEAIEAAMRKVTEQKVLEDTRIVLNGSMRRAPFERTERSAKLVHLAKQAGQELGLEIEDVGTGGASDGNITAAMGIPTIDGLGACGGLAHNPNEYIELDSLPIRIALFTGLVQHINHYYQSGQRL
jgi:glutamate carboxypeptidase